MTPEELSKTTLEDLEQLAARFSAALAVIKEAQLLINVKSLVNPVPAPVVATNIQWSPAELAEREKLRQQRFQAEQAELPEYMRAK